MSIFYYVCYFALKELHNRQERKDWERRYHYE